MKSPQSLFNQWRTHWQNQSQEWKDKIDMLLPSVSNDIVLAAFNGMMGDKLAARNSPYAITMTLTDQDQVLSDQTNVLSKQYPNLSNKVVVCVHGWCMSDKQWLYQQHDHGQALKAYGYSPIYLNYNTGKHISLNGEEFAFRLEKLLQAWPVAIEELVIIGHSMGGLVTRSACYYAKEHQLNWLSQLTSFITLGTPHNGAPLAEMANWIDDNVKQKATFKLLNQLADIRSDGTRDLSCGYIIHQDWTQDRDPKLDKYLPPNPPKKRAELPEHVQCYAIASCVTSRRVDQQLHLIGDGLVPVTSAWGMSESGLVGLGYGESHRFLAEKVTHLGLLSSPLVLNQIVNWLNIAQQKDKK
ncbi:TPA: alpha/beta hydrolase [Photobacterium damselae]|uniref:PGAP1-like alpha/beta domain-containing protein n=1 Tax=Photobacterium damselae TaxID=38293 RepID=UPI00084B2EE8|nr:hypothetical protein [Photobacterium damselae]OEC81978.1 hypothetical protein A9D46_02960 [Photobacterium damselae subsp. damselae]